MAFQSILNKSSSNTGLIITEAGTFSLDINTVEQHTSKLRVTENPIENGANIADHAVLDPKEVTVNGLVVSYEVNTPSIDRMLGYDFPRISVTYGGSNYNGTGRETIATIL